MANFVDFVANSVDFVAGFRFVPFVPFVEFVATVTKSATNPHLASSGHKIRDIHSENDYFVSRMSLIPCLPRIATMVLQYPVFLVPGTVYYTTELLYVELQFPFHRCLVPD